MGCSMPVNFHELFEKFIIAEDEKSAGSHPLVKGRYRVGDISYIRCIHDVIKSREKPEFPIGARKKMMRGKILHSVLEEVYKSSGHVIMIEKNGKKIIEYMSSRVPGQSFKIVGQPDIFDQTDGIIVEFKTTDNQHFNDLREPYEYHVAQASLYAYMNGVDKIRLIYINAGDLDDKQFDMMMDRNAVVRGIETADVLFYRDIIGRLPELIPAYLVSSECRMCMRNLKDGSIRCEQDSL